MTKYARTHIHKCVINEIYVLSKEEEFHMSAMILP